MLTRNAFRLARVFISIFTLLLLAPASAAPLPDPAEFNVDRADASEIPPNSPATLGYVLAGQFSSPEQAASAREEFQRQGTATFTDSLSKSVELITVYFGPFDQAALAERLIKKLRLHLIDAFVFEGVPSRHFVVHVGAFTTSAFAEARMRELEGAGLLGFKVGRKQVSSRTYRLWVRVDVERVERAAPVAEVTLPVATVPVPVVVSVMDRVADVEIVPADVAVTDVGPSPLPVVGLAADALVAMPLLTGRTRASWRVLSWNWRQRGEPASAVDAIGRNSAAASTLDGRFKFDVGVRGDFWWQSALQSGTMLAVDFLANSVSYHEEANTWSVGLQRINWNRAPQDSGLDGLATRDLSHFLLDSELEQRRRVNVAALWRRTEDKGTLEVVWLPVFRPAHLPKLESIWHPVNRERGRIRGLENNSLLGEIARNGTVSEDPVRWNSAWGIRMTRASGRRFQGVTMQNFQRSEPYFVVSPSLRVAMAEGLPPARALARSTGPALDIIHPATWLIGMEEGSDSWHFEVAWSSTNPVTLNDLTTATASLATWQSSVKVLPRELGLKHWITLSGTHLLTSDTVLDRTNTLRLSGHAQAWNADRTWRWGAHYLVGLDHVELHLNPAPQKYSWASFGTGSIPSL